jgi:hypothetical protein
VMQKVDLYDGAYGNFESDTYRWLRIETYGETLDKQVGSQSRSPRKSPNCLALGSILPYWRLAAVRGICGAPCRKIGLLPGRVGHYSIRGEPTCSHKRSLLTSVFRAVRRFVEAPFDDRAFDAVFSN